MEFLKSTFQKMKDAKAAMDQYSDDAEKGIVDLNAKVLRANSDMSEEDAQKEAQKISKLATQGGMMAGSIEDVGAKAAKGIGQGIAKIFRDPEALAPVANRAGKIADLQNTMNMGKSMANPEIMGLAGKTQQARLDNLPEYAKQAVLKLMRERGIDPSKLGQ